MALTDPGKRYVLDNDMKAADLYVGLAVDPAISGAGVTRAPGALTEASNTPTNYGYARGLIPTAGRATTAAGVLTFGDLSTNPLTVFTP